MFDPFYILCLHMVLQDLSFWISQDPAEVQVCMSTKRARAPPWTNCPSLKVCSRMLGPGGSRTCALCPTDNQTTPSCLRLETGIFIFETSYDACISVNDTEAELGNSVEKKNKIHVALNADPLQYPCLENPMDGGVWWAIVHGVTKSRTQLSDQHLVCFDFRQKWFCTLCVCVCIKLLQPCLTLCDPMDCSPPGSSVHGILQARILEWVAMPSSRGSSWPRDQTSVS